MKTMRFPVFDATIAMRNEVPGEGLIGEKNASVHDSWRSGLAHGGCGEDFHDITREEQQKHDNSF